MTQNIDSLFWFDAHLDLAYMAVAGRDMTAADPATSGGEDTPGCVTFPSLMRGGVKWALATIFTQTHAPDMPYGYGEWSDVDGARNAGVAQLHQYQQWEKEGLVRIVKTAAELDPSPAADAPLQVILLMEGADPIASENDAQWWFDQGVRVVTLCWTHGSRYAAGNGMPSANGGLTAAGESLIAKLDTLGIIHDLTHLNDASLGKLMHLSTGKMIATHSASRTLQQGALEQVDGVESSTVAQRHITDSMLAQLRERDGMVGLPLYARFLHAPGEERPSLDRVADHLDYLAAKLGSDVALHAGGKVERDAANHTPRHCTRLGMGSDFDGGFSANDTPVGLEGPEKFGALAKVLNERGWSPEALSALACDNWLRYFKSALPG